MTGIITWSMPVFVVENRAHGNRAHATINEGLGQVLRFGATDDSVIARLRWLATEAGPLLGAALRHSRGIDLRALMAQALRMGDEMHQRNVAASALLARALMPHVARAGGRHGAVARLAEFVAGNDQFFLNVGMAAGKAMADLASGVPHSTLVTAMARNGTDFGIRVSGLGARWFVAPVETPVGLYFPGFGADDANPDLGDSAIVETIGLGAGAMAASPAAARFVGAGGMAEALAATAEIAEICHGEHPYFRIPTLEDRGAPAGIDVRRVVDDQFPFAELRALGYEALVAGQQTYNGVAVLTRAGAEEVARRLPDEGNDAQRRLLVARVAGLKVMSIYGPNGQEVGSDKYAYKLDWYRRFRAFLETSSKPDEALVLCGDLNIAPEDRDVWDPEKWRGQIMFSDPERAAFRDLVSWGLRDSLRLHRQEGGLFTWWDYRAGAFHRGWGLRIDHVLLTPALAARCLSVEIDRDERKGKKPSDHAPVVATLAD